MLWALLTVTIAGAVLVVDLQSADRQALHSVLAKLRPALEDDPAARERALAMGADR